MGMALAAMAAKKSDPEPSGAPKPMSLQVGGRGSSVEEIAAEDAGRSDKLTTKTWMERRQAYINKKKAAGERIW